MLNYVITDISGKSGIFTKSGEKWSTVVLSELAEGRARDKIPEMQKSYKDGYQNISLKHHFLTRCASQFALDDMPGIDFALDEHFQNGSWGCLFRRKKMPNSKEINI